MLAHGHWRDRFEPAPSGFQHQITGHAPIKYTDARLGAGRNQNMLRRIETFKDQVHAGLIAIGAINCDTGKGIKPELADQCRFTQTVLKHLTNFAKITINMNLGRNTAVCIRDSC